jgi:hypothetical protein
LKKNIIAGRCFEISKIVKAEKNGLSEVKLCLRLDIHPETLRRTIPFLNELYPQIHFRINEDGKRVLICEE